MTKLEIKTTWRALAGVLIIALLVAIAITYLLTYVSSNEGFILHMTALSIGYIVLILRWIIKYWPGKFVRFDQKGILIRKRSIFGKEEEYLYLWKYITRIAEGNGRMNIVEPMFNRVVSFNLKEAVFLR